MFWRKTLPKDKERDISRCFPDLFRPKHKNKKKYRKPFCRYIKRYYYIVFYSSFPGEEEMRQTTTSESWLIFSLLESGLEVDNIVKDLFAGIECDPYPMDLLDLNSDPSTHNNNATRRSYFEENVMNKYFAGDSNLQREFFEDCAKRGQKGIISVAPKKLSIS